MVQLLLGYGARIGAEIHFGEQPIDLAVKSGSIESLHVLIGKGATLHCTNQVGQQPLRCAAESSSGRLDVIESLIRSGADVDTS